MAQVHSPFRRGQRGLSLSLSFSRSCSLFVFLSWAGSHCLLLLLMLCLAFLLGHHSAPKRGPLDVYTLTTTLSRTERSSLSYLCDHIKRFGTGIIERGRKREREREKRQQQRRQQQQHQYRMEQQMWQLPPRRGCAAAETKARNISEERRKRDKKEKEMSR